MTARERAADADQSLVGEHLDDGMHVVFGREFFGPPALDRAARQPGEAHVRDLHGLLRFGSGAVMIVAVEATRGRQPAGQPTNNSFYYWLEQ